MKRIYLTLLLLLPALTFAGCNPDEERDNRTEIPGTPGNGSMGNDQDSDNDDTAGGDTAVITPGGKILIAYFSRWGNTDYPSDVDATTGASIFIVDGQKTGTTQIVANYIQDAIGGDIHLIETTDTYPVDFNEVRDQNHAEQAAGTLPVLKNRIEDMDGYETVFIGYPVWATDVPQAIKSFLADYDMSGKKVIPFCTHDGYGASRSYTSVQNAARGAEVLEGLALLASEVPSARTQVQDWLKKTGFEPEEQGGQTSSSVVVTAGDHSFDAEWLDTPLAKEIRAMFPLSATLGRYGGREYYGSMPQRPTHTEEGQLTFTNGDITYCPSNNTIAIFYAKDDDPQMGHLSMRIIPIGRVTSPLEAFDEMESRLEFVFADK